MPKVKFGRVPHFSNKWKKSKPCPLWPNVANPGRKWKNTKAAEIPLTGR
jgi:hypothetical protein